MITIQTTSRGSPKKVSPSAPLRSLLAKLEICKGSKNEIRLMLHHLSARCKRLGLETLQDWILRWMGIRVNSKAWVLRRGRGSTPRFRISTSLSKGSTSRSSLCFREKKKSLQDMFADSQAHFRPTGTNLRKIRPKKTLALNLSERWATGCKTGWNITRERPSFYLHLSKTFLKLQTTVRNRLIRAIPHQLTIWFWILSKKTPALRISTKSKGNSQSRFKKTRCKSWTASCNLTVQARMRVQTSGLRAASNTPQSSTLPSTARPPLPRSHPHSGSKTHQLKALLKKTQNL